MVVRTNGGEAFDGFSLPTDYCLLPTDDSPMERILRRFENFEDSAKAEHIDDNATTMESRFKSFMDLMEPYYHASGGLQRVYRTDDFKSRSIRDDWRIRLQPLPKSTSNG